MFEAAGVTGGAVGELLVTTVLGGVVGGGVGGVSGASVWQEAVLVGDEAVVSGRVWAVERGGGVVAGSDGAPRGEEGGGWAGVCESGASGV